MSEIGHAGPEVHVEDIPGASEAMKRTIATLVMTITLLGTVFAFLQSRADNLEARAARRSGSASLESMAKVIEAGSVVDRDRLAYDLATDNIAVGNDYAIEDSARYAAYFQELSEVELRVADEYNEFVEVEQNPKYADIEEGALLQFEEDLRAPSYEEAELDKQYAIERDGWRRKADTFVAVITVLAFALFLVGLSSHISPAALKPFVWAAGFIAVVATAWGGVTFFRHVQEPTPEAIHHFVEGTVAFNTAQDADDYEHVIEAAGKAIEERDGYIDAHLLRGNASFNLDFFNEEGPQGSEQALEDYLVVLEENPNDWVATGNAGATYWWLGDYQESYDYTVKALELKPGDPVYLLNRVEALIGIDPDIELDRELAELRERFSEIPGWQRDSVLESAYEGMELAIETRPEVAEKEAELLEALKRMHHEINVSLLMMGTPDPPPIDATVFNIEFDLSRDRETLEVGFDYKGMEENQAWLYRTYINNTIDEVFSSDPEVFDFPVPSGGVILTFTDPAQFTGGDVIRTEIFVDGNLLNAGEYEIP